MNKNKKSIEEVLVEFFIGILGESLAEIVQGVLLSIVGMVCWNHLAERFHFPEMRFLDAIAIYGLIWCVFEILSIGIKKCVDAMRNESGPENSADKKLEDKGAADAEIRTNENQNPTL